MQYLSNVTGAILLNQRRRFEIQFCLITLIFGKPIVQPIEAVAKLKKESKQMGVRK